MDFNEGSYVMITSIPSFGDKLRQIQSTGGTAG